MRSLQQPDPAPSAQDALADALHLVAEAVRQIPRAVPGPRLVTSRQDDVLLTRAQAAELLQVSASTVDRITKGKPCRRRVGGMPRIERAGLLALVRAAR